MHSEETNKLIKVEIEGDRDKDNSSIRLVFKELSNTGVDLTDSRIDDIKTLFDQVFDFMIDSRQLVEFELNDTKNDLFHDISEDIVSQLNSEIAESKDNIEKIWALTPEDDTEQDSAGAE